MQEPTLPSWADQQALHSERRTGSLLLSLLLQFNWNTYTILVHRWKTRERYFLSFKGKDKKRRIWLIYENYLRGLNIWNNFTDYRSVVWYLAHYHAFNFQLNTFKTINIFSKCQNSNEKLIEWLQYRYLPNKRRTHNTQK